MISRLSFLFAGVLSAGLLGSAHAQVGDQVAPVLAHPLFKDAGRGPAGTYTLPGGLSVLLSQSQGYLLSGTVQAKYEAPSGLSVSGGTGGVSGGTGAAQATSAQGVSGANVTFKNVAAAIGVLSGYGDGLAGPLEQFLNRPDVPAQLERGFSIRADPFTISARTEAGVLKVTISQVQVPAEAFLPVKTVLPARKAAAKPVVLRVYSDFQCPFCQKFETETLPTLLAKLPDDVSIEFHQFPLEQIHPLARPSAEASECAGQQGKFWAYKDALFTDRSWLASNPQEVFTRLAGKVGLDMPAFQKCVDTRAGKAAVDAGLLEAMKLGVNGTPTVFVNGFRAGNAYDANGLLNLINFARVAGAVPAPTPVKP